MKTFKITFRHTEVKEFEAFVKASTEEEALEILEESLYDYVEDQEGNLIEGKDFEVIDVIDLKTENN